MAKEWANKDKYHPFNGVLEPRIQMPRVKVIVTIVPAWGDRKVAGGAASQAPPFRPVYSPVRPVLVWADNSSVSMLL
jgi:hypothetical protein